MSIKTAAEQTSKLLKKKLPAPEYERLIKPKPKPSARKNTGKSTYRKKA